MIATLTARQTTPREWTPAEGELIRETAQRTWAAVERAKAEEALAVERKRFFNVLETLPVMVCLITPDYHIPFANKAFRDKFGEAEGRPCYELCCGFDQPCSFCESLLPLTTGQPHHWEFTSPDGNTIIDAYDFPFTDIDGSPTILEMDIDITENKKIEMVKERYLNIAEERAAWLQAIIDLIPAGIWISDHTGKVTMVNQEAVNMYRDRSPLAGSPEEYTSYKLFLPDTDEPVAFEPYVTKEALIGVVLDFERFDGTRGTQVVSTEALRDKDGNIINYVAIAMDITPLRQTERALRESEKNALDLVEKLRRADKNRNAFLSMLSHELRNPLASIMMSLDLLNKVPADGKHAAMALEIAKRQGQQLTCLVDDLLDISRITQNKVVLKKERVELNEIIKKSILDYRSHFVNKMVRFEVKLTTPLHLEADSARLIQVIDNLLHNAAKFTSNDDLVTIIISRDTNANEAEITIQDTGQGIDPEHLENLFEPFTQVDTSLDRKDGGLGLGLAIVKGMVELHGGRVEAFSEGRNKGAKFTIRLPLSQEDIEESERDERLDPSSNGSLRILLIDDNKDLAGVMGELIDFIGHKTTAAYNGMEGISKARELRPDAIICDIGLPGMSGYEVAQLIRKDPELRDAFLIALSGYAQPEDVERSKRAGFDRHLGKPVSIETLQQVLNEVIESKYLQEN